MSQKKFSTLNTRSRKDSEWLDLWGKSIKDEKPPAFENIAFSNIVLTNQVFCRSLLQFFVLFPLQFFILSS